MSETILKQIDEAVIVEQRKKLLSKLDNPDIEVNNGYEFTNDHEYVTLAYLITDEGNEYSIQKNILTSEIEVFSIISGVLTVSYDIENISDFINQRIN